MTDFLLTGVARRDLELTGRYLLEIACHAPAEGVARALLRADLESEPERGYRLTDDDDVTPRELEVTAAYLLKDAGPHAPARYVAHALVRAAKEGERR